MWKVIITSLSIWSHYVLHGYIICHIHYSVNTEKYLEGRGRSFNELLFYFSSYPFSIAELDVISCKITIKSLRMK